MRNTFLLVNPLETWSKKIHLPAAWLQLKAHYLEYGKHSDKWEWLPPFTHIDEFDRDSLVTEICVQSPTVIGFSMQMWNSNLNFSIAEAVRKRLPNAIIVAGGPFTQHKYNMAWFKDHPAFDILCSQEGYGEDFLTTYLDMIVDGNIDYPQIPNAIYPTASRMMWKKSNLVTDKREFKYPSSLFNGSEEYIQTLGDIARFHGKRLALNYETTRGCPYGCTFCDWPGGLLTKIIRKPPEVIDNELDAIKRLRINEINLCDANFGALNKRDINIAERFVEISKHGDLDSVSMYGKAKHSIEIVEKIDTMLLEAGLYGQDDIYIITINSVEEEILDAIQRTNQSFDKFIPVAERIREKYGKKIKLEMIMGLPMSTLDSFYREFDSLDRIEGWATERHPWALLTESPGARPEYIEKYEIETIAVGYYSGDDITNQVYTSHLRPATALTENLTQDTYQIVIKTNTYTTEQWHEMYAVDHFARALELSEFVREFRRDLAARHGITAGQFYRQLWKQLKNSPQFADIIGDITQQIVSITQGQRLRYEWFTNILHSVVLIKLEAYFNMAVMLRPAEFYQVVRDAFDIDQQSDAILTDTASRVFTYTNTQEALWTACRVFLRKVR
jgi:putative methyltransferase